MMNSIKVYFIIIMFFCFGSHVYASVNNITLESVYVDLEDTSAIKRGSRIFFNYCQGCHSLKYMRYSDLATGLKVGKKGDTNIIREYFLHGLEGISENSPILSSMSKENSIKWFGKVPPDLSLVSRYRSPDWIYTYMLSFYKDKSRPWGVNNILFPDVGMPHVLLNLQGVQKLRDIHEHSSEIYDMLETVEYGELSRYKYDLFVCDLVAFLTYVGEPHKVEREKIGSFVLVYVIVMSILLYLIKKSYWKNIK